MPYNNETNPGSSLVDTQQLPVNIPQVNITSLPSPKALTPPIDCTQAVAFNVSLLPKCTGGNLANTVEILARWFDPTQTIILKEKYYEINIYQTTDGTFVTTNISDVCRGAFVQFWMTATNFNAALTGVPSTISGTFTPSSRLIYKAEISEQPIEPASAPIAYPGIGSSSDGNLSNSIGSTALGAGVSTGLLQFALSAEDIMIAISGAGANAQLRFRGGFGAGAAPTASDEGVQFTLDTPVLAAANNQTAIFGPYKAVSRPLFGVLTNFSANAATGCQVFAWTAGN